MANYNEYKCFTCGQIFEYCRRCAITPVIYKEEGFCSENCSDIFNILSKHGCNLITAEETLAELESYNVDEIKLTEDIKAHIESLKSESTIKAEISVEETVIEKSAVKTVKQSNKKQ